MSEHITDGIQETLNDLAPDLQIEIVPELESENELRDVTKRFALEKDAIILLRSSGVQFLKNNPQPVPSFFGAANDPVLLGITSNTERPGGNVTGVTYSINFNEIFTFYKQIIKDFDNILLLYEEGHPGAVIDRVKTKKSCKEQLITYHEAGCRDIDDILRYIDQYRNVVDAVILANQNFFYSNVEVIVENTSDIACFSYNPILVRKGILGSIAADDHKLGRMLAGSIMSVLYGGKRTGDVPIKSDSDPQIVLNIQTAERLGIIIPMHILKIAEVFQ